MIGELEELLDKLCAAEASALSDPASIERLHRALARLDAVTTRATAAFDADSSWQGDGARTTAAWLAARCRIPQRSASRRVALARALRHLPAAAEAWLAGDICDAHVDLLARARNEASAEALERDEQMLVAEARRHRFGWFARIVAYWRHSADADGIEDEAADQHQRRRLHHSQSIEGMWFGDYVLDPISGTVVGSALARIEHELFHAEWAEAKAALGRDPGAGELARNPAQRRADALVEMARRAGAVGPGARLPEPLFTVLVGYEAFSGRMCQLADNTVVSPGGACSPAPPEEPSRCETWSASTPPARCPPRPARSTTWRPGRRAGSPPPPTAGRRAPSTTGPATAGGRHPSSSEGAGRRHGPRTAWKAVPRRILVTDMNKALHDAGYTALGFAVLAFQRAQVRRRELERELKKLLSSTCRPPSAHDEAARGNGI